MDDNCMCFGIFLIKVSTCSMDPETAVTCTHGHFNHVVFAVHETGEGAHACGCCPRLWRALGQQQVAIYEPLSFMSGLKKHSPHEVRTAFLTLRHAVISLDWLQINPDYCIESLFVSGVHMIQQTNKQKWKYVKLERYPCTYIYIYIYMICIWCYTNITTSHTPITIQSIDRV